MLVSSRSAASSDSSAPASASPSSASSALNAKNAAEAALDTFDDDFLGSKASDPAVDNDGDALADGALYFNTTVHSNIAYCVCALFNNTTGVRNIAIGKKSL